VRIGEPFQLVARPKFGRSDIIQGKPLAERQCSSVNEGRNTAKYQVAAKIDVIENRPGYICLPGVVEGSGRSKVVGRRIDGLARSHRRFLVD
jgi:hypothetical protein